MPSENNSVQKAKTFLSITGRFINTKTLFFLIFLFLVILVGYVSKNLYESKTQEYKEKIFMDVNDDILSRFEMMLKEKIDTSVLISSSLSKNVNIKKALVSNAPEKLDMKKLLSEMKTTREYVDIQVELISEDGISLRRSWTGEAGDDLVKDDEKMAHLIKYPRVSTTIDATKYGLVISNKIPIYSNDNFEGFFGVNIHFDSLVDIFAKEGFDSVILLNKADSKKIYQDVSYSKKFISDCYVVNSNANDYLIKIIKNKLEEFCDKDWEKVYKIDAETDNLVSRYIMNDMNQNPIAEVILFKSIEEIDFVDLDTLQKIHILATVFILLFIAFLVNYSYISVAIKELKLENEELIHVNDDLKTKTDQMDFNDKKLDNMFNMQPNLMFMHNGKEITKVNKRYMGFFNRFGTFDGFKKKHKCVSELFEKYDAPNYIWDQYIDNEFWIDYLLNNPRRLYKTVMSINGDPHHFIIKFNELEYAQHVTERVIIVALVDMTQDLVNYKVLDESATKSLNSFNEKLELKEEKGNTDISYELQSQFEYSLRDVTGLKTIEKSVSVVSKKELNGQSIIKVEGDLMFKDVESRWKFFISAQTSSKILNIVSKMPDDRVLSVINKDTLETAREFITLMSYDLCEQINRKHFHDLKDARYKESTTVELDKKDISKLTNLFKFTVKLDNDMQLEFYTTIDEDLSPFMSQLVGGEKIKSFQEQKNEKITEEKEHTIEEITEKAAHKESKEEVKDSKVKENVKKEDSLEKKEIEEKDESNDEKKELVSIVDIIEEEHKKEEEKKEEPKKEEFKEQAVTKNIGKAKVVKKELPITKKQAQVKFDAYSLIQNSFMSFVAKKLQKDITKTNLKVVKGLKSTETAFVKLNSSFEVKAQNRKLEWSVLVPQTVLSDIFSLSKEVTHAELVNCANIIINDLRGIINEATKGEVTFKNTKPEVLENLDIGSKEKIFDIGIMAGEKSIPMFIVL